ncbi:DEAD/DEAH box helicase [Spirabiliibacterium falconis]|uniref:DEAD/DEAH box helicase n=1 Tax=Spirabiliibacterium falconis TaxID=572023 RepID=UPI001AAD3554|nr:DEAD/DEAH box helicase [Spirabiliibacterium falconis]MBE2894803.1 DEAD/DEAH box helicase [Spirabiliibacterium falconis]
MTEHVTTFNDLGLPNALLRAVSEMGFTSPSPIQKACIPLLLAGQDVLGMAQTGSGKTAAFSLPLLAQLDPNQHSPQILVMAPTRELAIQVADACEQFCKYLEGIRCVTLYGGQRYDIQLRALRQGAQVVVGTPGRILDHIRRGTLDLSGLRFMVLDEADEMLRMGFIDDVEEVMSKLPEQHQTALFSATMPAPIRHITHRFMRNPQEVKIQSSPQNLPDITQVCWYVHGVRKNEALLRFLEVEHFDAAIIFTRTKTATLDIAALLERHGYSCAALNGDMTQQLREQALDRLRNGSLNILIATDVAARGLDVDRISLVVNYDIPLDAESYVHRIGRTGRAGRAGRALLFVEPRERRLLRNIEQLTKKRIDEVQLPNHIQLEQCRREKFKQTILTQLEHASLEQYRTLLLELFPDIDSVDLASAMMMQLQGKQKLILPPDVPMEKRRERSENPRSAERGGRRDRTERRARERGNDIPMDRYRIEVGRGDGVEVKHIVGAIANEGDIDSRYIGHIKLYDSHSTVELPQNMPQDLLRLFNKTRVMNKPMQMSFVEAVKGEGYNERTRGKGGKFSTKGRDNNCSDKPQFQKKRRERRGK